MEGLIDWCGFLGAWALFTGPVYQASLELRAEEFEREDLERLRASAEPPEPVSPWWWLVPPVAYLLRHRQTNEAQERLVASLDERERQDLLSFMNKAAGWMLVSLGALLIAVKETYELVEHYEWNHAVFWVLVALMPLVASTFTVSRNRRTQEMLGRDRP